MKPERSAIVKEKSEDVEVDRTKDSTFDRIYRFYHSNKTRVQLTDVEERIRDRWEKAWLLLNRHRTRKQVAELLVKFFDVALSVAFDDVKHAMMLFSNPMEEVKEAKRAIAETMALNGAKKCWESGDMEGYYKFWKAYNDVNQLGTDKDNGLGDLLKKMKPHQVIIVSSEAELEAKANKLQQDLIKDIEHSIID